MVVVVVIVVAAVLVAGAGWLLVNRGRRADGVDSFRRQIDALSAEARRSTVDQVKEQGQVREHRADDPDTGGDPEPDAGGDPDGA